MAARNPGRTGGSFSVDALRLPLAALGIFGILASLAVWLVNNGQFDLLPRALMAVGILLVGVYVALDPADAWGRLSGRGVLASGNTVVLALAAVAMLGLVNVLASRYQTKWDLTASKQFSLSQQSIDIARNLPQPVQVTAFLPANDSRRQDFTTLLNDYVRYSDNKLSYQIVDPETRPGEAIAAGITEVGTTVYQMGDKKQNSTGTTENDISTALVKLERPEKKLVFTIGHGERSLDGLAQTDYSQLKQTLNRDNFSTEPLNLTTSRAVPDDAAAVVVAGPTNPFLPEEKDALRAYLDGGGKLLLLLDPGSKADFNDLLQPYGVAFNGALIVDPIQNFLGDPRVPVVQTYPQQAVTKDLRLGTFYPGATSISVPAQPPAGVTATPVAQSSAQSYPSTAQDQKGPQNLAVAVERTAAGGQGTAGGKTTRLFLVGTANLVANGFLNVASGNQDLFVNAASWLGDEVTLIAVKPPDTTPRTLLLTGPQLNLVMYSSLLFLPLAVLAAGAAVWWTRR